MTANPWPPPDPDLVNQTGVALDDRPAEPAPSGSPVGLVAVGLILASIGIFYSWGAFIFVMALIVCIFLHELGHYLAAKRAGMKVTQFFLFFGPRLWSFRRGETEFGVRLIPAGAFVKVPGMHNLDAEVDPADEPRTFRQAPFRGRFLMAAAGSCMHFAIALLLLFISLVFVGRPKAPYDWSIADVLPATAAAEAGLQPGDRIVAIDGVPYERYDKVVDFIVAHPDTTVAIDVQRGDQLLTKTTTIRVSNDACRPGGLLGIRSQAGDTRITPVGAPKAVQQAFVEFGTTIGQSIQGLGKIFSPSGLRTYSKAIQTGCNTDQRMVSPIGAAKFGADFCRDAGDCILLLSAVNIFIGVVNWFPMLPFDGGHMLIALYEKVRSRRGKRYYANIAPLLPITYALFALMLVLFIGNTYLDLRELISMAFERRNTRPIMVGKVPVGGGAPITVQSMTTTKTADVEGTLQQIYALTAAGCDIVRCTCNEPEAAEGLAQIVPRSPVPIVADIHHQYKMALAALEAGVHCLRLNPGNIRKPEHIKLVAQECKDRGVPIRIGVNGGSLDPALYEKYGGKVTPEAMVESARQELAYFAEVGFEDVKISVKASNIMLMIEAYRQLADVCDYPLHLGVTEAGPLPGGLLKATAGIATLLAEGIGDTIRYSLTADPVEEAKAGRQLLEAMGLRERKNVDLIACPSCGRAEVDVIDVANRAQAAFQDKQLPLQIAVMGCVVNGPGEAREADLGIAAGNKRGHLFVKGTNVAVVPESEMVEALVEWAEYIMEHGTDAAIARADVAKAARAARLDRDELLADKGADANDAGTRIDLIRKRIDA